MNGKAGRWLRFAALIVVAWCAMTFTHEAGHLVGGWLGGGTLQDADLWPWHLPYSLFEPDPRPLVTLWAGPILGALVPLAVAMVVRREAAWFIASFCLLANGAYLAASWLSGDRFLDAPRLLAAGALPFSLAIYCALTIGLGYARFRKSCMAILQRREGTTDSADEHG